MDFYSSGRLRQNAYHCYDGSLTRRKDVETSLRTLFRRCVQCPPIPVACPTSCASDEACIYRATTCDSCGSTSCAKKSELGSTTTAATPTSSTSSIGPIVGGVVGGIVAIIIMTFLVWRFCIRPRRRQNQLQWEEDTRAEGVEKGEAGRFSAQRSQRASAATLGSIASTSSSFTRASNVIQIAYIPGVTNRSDHSSPELIPPVPPIPAASTLGSVNSSPHMSPHMSRDDQHFFRLSNLRDSTYSGFSDGTGLANRNSVASTVYRNNAVVNPLPAQAATRMKATPVSVKSSGRPSPNISRSVTPPLPVSSGQHSPSTKSSIVGRVGAPRTVMVTRKRSDNQHDQIYELDGSESERSGSPFVPPDRRFANASPQHSHHSSTFEDASSDDEDSNALAGRRLMGRSRRSEVTTINEDSPTSPQMTTPFVKLTENESRRQRKTSTSLNQIIEEATRKASQVPVHGLGHFQNPRPEPSPFSDANAARTP